VPRIDFRLKASDKAVKDYYASLAQGAQLQIDHELGVRHAFEALLDRSAHRHFNGGLAREYSVRRGSRTLRPDGCVLDEFRLTRGWYEAKSAGADLEQEARAKLAQGYPRQNTLFWQPGRILLYQGSEIADFDITEPTRLVDALRLFFEHEEPELERWEEAVSEFKERVPELARGVLDLIHREKRTNRPFRAAFDAFMQLCQTALNPNISMAAVEEMLIQHLLTERIFRRVFENPDFTRRNAIAAEIEKVIDALMSRSFSRQEFLKSLDPFYAAIEATAAGISDFSQKQGFLNTVYEQFFQGFSVKIADTHGIVYTPQPIVEFMVRSVDELLASEFGTSLAAGNVHVLDPFVGTGNFLIRVLRQIADTKKSALPQKYASELHANEVMLLPYYIASLNIEHTYYELTGRYEPFEGICLVDTFELAEKQIPMGLTQTNTERVERQRRAPIRVVIGNPPYNVGQINENDNNKNRKYEAIDRRVRETYARASSASSTSKLDDPYIKAIRWATDRIGDEGIVAFVCNSGFLDGIATDGMRKYLEEEFDRIYVLDLGGNVRKNPKLSGTTHNVFGIQVGVSINLLVRRRGEHRNTEVLYCRTGEEWRREDRLRFIEEQSQASAIAWKKLAPDAQHIWLTEGMRADYDSLVPLSTKDVRAGSAGEGVLFQFHTLGVTTARDAWVYNFDREALAENVRRMVEVYNTHVARWPRAEREGKELNDWVESDTRVVAWSEGLKQNLRRGRLATFAADLVCASFFRPYTREFLYYGPVVIERARRLGEVFPFGSKERNLAIWSKVPQTWPYFCLAVDRIVDYLPEAGSQVFPFYTFDSSGSNRQENISDWALDAFRLHYGDETITKWDIFHYVYAILHHLAYRVHYASNLRRDLPRVPLASEFRPFAKAGARLAELHVDYEDQPEFPLAERWKEGAPLDFRVERMKYDPASGAIVYNDALTLSGIPREVERYRLGHRSALGWVVDQYRVTTDKRSGIVNDPNREDDPKYILRLIGQIVTVSIETVRIVDSLPDLGLPEAS
jgi:predicted helicase